MLTRLIEDEERHWTDENVDVVATKHFPSINKEEAISRPILFSNWLSKDYSPVDREELREYTKARLKVGARNQKMTISQSISIIHSTVWVIWYAQFKIIRVLVGHEFRPNQNQLLFS